MAYFFLAGKCKRAPWDLKGRLQDMEQVVKANTMKQENLMAKFSDCDSRIQMLEQEKQSLNQNTQEQIDTLTAKLKYVVFIYTQRECERINCGYKRQPTVEWRDRVLGCMWERGEKRLRDSKKARVDCVDRSKWRLICRGCPLEGVTRKRRQGRLD